MGHKPVDSIARYDGKEAVVLLARAKTDIDVLKSTNDVQRIVDEFVDEGGGQGTTIGTVRSQAREIHYMMTQLGTSAVYGLILVVIILWVAMGWRNAGLISMAVPLAILMAGGIAWFTKMTVTPDLSINNMTLFATILTIGMIVDGCIIVGENIYRHRELGRTPVEAAKRGISEVGPSLMSAYLTTFAAFGPMFMIRGIMGDFMKLLPVVVLFTLIAAMVVDHFILPVLSVYFMKVPKRRLEEIEEKNEGQTDLSPEEIEIANAEAVVASSKTKQAYGRMLGYALHHRLLVITLALIVTFTPIGLYMSGAIGVEFFPDGDAPWIQVSYELPLGSSMEKRTKHVGEIIEKAVLEALQPDEWNQQSEGAPRVRPVTLMGRPGALNIDLQSEDGTGPEFGKVYVELALAEDRERSADQIIEAVRKAIPPLPGVIINISKFKDGPPAGTDVAVRVLGRKQSEVAFDELAVHAKEIEKLVRSVPGTKDVTSDYRLRPELQVKPKRVIARLFDVDSAQIANAVNYALEGVKVGEVDFGGNEKIDLRLRNTRSERDEIEDLANLPLRSPTGKVVNLEQVASIDRVQNLNVYRHYDGSRVINVRCDLEDSVSPDKVKRMLVRAMRPDLTVGEQGTLVRDRHSKVIYADDGIIIEFGGENEIRDDAMEDLTIAMGLAMALMVVILVIKFNSFVQPAVVLFSVPLSLVGVAIGLMICGFYFSVAAMIGVVALAGIVVNDAIVLVDFVNRLRKTGVPLEKAIVFAGQLRLRPIMITTVTTIGGLLPLGLNLAGGGEFFQPLTVSIMFGLGFATLLQLFLIPLAIYTFDRGEHRGMLDPAQNPKLAGDKAVSGPKSLLSGIEI